MLIIAGLYCSNIGIENRSLTFSTTTPTILVSPTFTESADWSNRNLPGCPCGGFTDAAFGVLPTVAPGAAAAGAGVATAEACAIDFAGSAAGVRISASRLT